MRPRVEDILLSFKLSSEQANNYKAVKEKFEEHFKLSEALQCNPELILEKAINKVRTKKEVKTQQAVIRGMEAAANLDRIRSFCGRRDKRCSNGSQQQRMKVKAVLSNYCSRCCITSKHAFSSCSAKLTECNNCKKKGHWAAVCKKKNVHEINKNDGNKKTVEEDKEDLYLGDL
ncbi:hypothetical protein ALC57_14249 [Trachymyrmex cornetzi]|uniref:CCHC-type domain-containing protein n=1 Tax=Trachymyrmex cornetzi TaxID=471704 RepID=A0A195DKZ0_9HYME|nr:hypothetical protein ALC57_14249 [Trachymyrmex cornetzi]